MECAFLLSYGEEEAGIGAGRLLKREKLVRSLR